MSPPKSFPKKSPTTRPAASLPILLASLLLGVTCLAVAPAAALDERFRDVQSAIDRGEAAEALAELERLVGKRPKSGEALMLRGTARVMLGDLEAGAADLEKAVEEDPTLRQAWLNLAGLEIAEGKYQEALGLLEKAHDLDPAAADSHLNLGAVLVLLGRRAEAKQHFDRYLEIEGGSAEAYYLVAANYALADLEHLVVETLGEAIRQDERIRLRARRDERFLGLDSLEYRVLLNTDEHTPPADHRTAAAAFRERYDPRTNRLLYALLDSLRQLGIPYEAEIESNARWALVWSDTGLRLKVHNQESGTGVIRASAPPDRFTREEWQRMTQELFRSIHAALGE